LARLCSTSWATSAWAAQYTGATPDRTGSEGPGSPLRAACPRCLTARMRTRYCFARDSGLRLGEG